MANLKVLKLEPWMVYTQENGDIYEMSYAEEPQVIGRNGWYRKGHFCWFEIAGKAFRSTDYKTLSEDFEYCLKQLNHRPLTNRQRKAIKQLMAERLAPQSMKELYYTDTDWRSLREVRRSSWFSVTKATRKIRKGRKHNA